MAVKITSADSIRKAIVNDALLRELFDTVEVNRSGMAPIGMGPTIGILGLPAIDGFEATWSLQFLGLTSGETRQVIEIFSRIFPGSVFKKSNEIVVVEIFSLVTKEVLDAVKEQQDIARQEQKERELDSAIRYASSVKDGKSGARGERGEQGLRGERGERGLMGPPGRDGRDLDATSVSLGDLDGVFIAEPKVGHVLTWDGSSWVALFVPQVHKVAGGGGGISEAPLDGETYVRRNGDWFKLSDALNALSNLDGGDFDTASSNASQILNGADAGSFD